MGWMENLISPDTWVFVLRILIACICGGAIGFERTKRLKEAGIRTHCIIASAAALLMVLSKYGFADLERSVGSFYPGTEGADPARIAAQIVSGISFLGAGVIFRNGNSVKGLTTASGIWATAAVGMAIGGGLYILGLAETILIVIIQIVFHHYSIGYDAYSAGDIRIVASDSEQFRTTLALMLDSKRIQLVSMRIERQGNGEAIYHIAFRTRRTLKSVDVIDLFLDNPGIHSISM